LRLLAHWSVWRSDDSVDESGGYIAFTGQPAANGTITLNSVTWTFVTGTPAGKQTQIGASLDATLTALATNLNASADAQVSKCTYTTNTIDDRLKIEFDTAGSTDNAFTLSASASSSTVSASTLIDGGYRQEWLSAATTSPASPLRLVIRNW
jgi:hypothetical protein